MSKFEQMCKALTDARNTWTGYRDRCFQHISSLSTGFVKYCEIPQGRFSYVPAKESERETEYSPHDAIQFDSSDGFWHFAWRIVLSDSPDSSRQQPVVVTLALSESENGKVIVKLGWDKEEHELDLSNQKQCEALYDSVARRIEGCFARNPQDFRGEFGSNKIGFSVL